MQLLTGISISAAVIIGIIWTSVKVYETWEPKMKRWICMKNKMTDEEMLKGLKALEKSFEG